MADARGRLKTLQRRVQLRELQGRYNPRLVLALFNFVNGGLSIGLLATVAQMTGSPFIFPSLGPTAFLLFSQPLIPASSPRNTLIGHLLGASLGWLSLGLFGLFEAPPALLEGVTWARVGAAALSLGATGATMVLLRAEHPPAGATTLIVSLGFMPHLWQLPVLLTAVMLLLLQALVINRLAGIAYPLWQPRDEAAGLS